MLPAWMSPAPLRRACALLATPLLALGTTACGSTVSTNGFTGESRAVAQRISDYQADVAAGSEQKLCGEDLAGAVRARLSAAAEAGRHSPATEAGGHAPSALADLGMRAERVSPQSVPVSASIPGSASSCMQALKHQLRSIDVYEATIEKNGIVVAGATATARVRSTWSGKLRTTTLDLVKQGGGWRIAGLGLK